MTTQEGLVSVQAGWNGWRSAEVQLRDLRDVHWFQPAGAHCRLLHAWIDCSEIVVGAIPHECDALSAPHRLHVCLLKSHTLPGIYAQLAKGALDVEPVGWQPVACAP
jgi:hypothetical protein